MDNVQTTVWALLLTADSEWHLVFDYKCSSTFSVDRAAEPMDMLYFS